MESLAQAAISKFGDEAAVRHQIELLNRRLRYAATAPGPRNFPSPNLPWDVVSYVTEFERLNSLRVTAQFNSRG